MNLSSLVRHQIQHRRKMARSLSQLCRGWKNVITSKPLLIVVAVLLFFTLIESQNFILSSVINYIHTPIMDTTDSPTSNSNSTNSTTSAAQSKTVFPTPDSNNTNSTTPAAQGKKIWSLSEMDDLLSQIRASPRIQVCYIWSQNLLGTS